MRVRNSKSEVMVPCWKTLDRYLRIGGEVLCQSKRGLVQFHRKMEHDRDSRCRFKSNADCCSEEGAAQ